MKIWKNALVLSAEGAAPKPTLVLGGGNLLMMRGNAVGHAHHDRIQQSAPGHPPDLKYY